MTPRTLSTTSNSAPTCFDLADLPRIQRNEILHGLGDQPVARPFGFLGQLIEGAKRRLVETYRESGGHGVARVGLARYGLHVV